MAKSEEPHLPADGQRGAVSAEAACQVLCGASPDSAGTDKVFFFFFFKPCRCVWLHRNPLHTPFQPFTLVRIMRREALAWNEPLLWAL